MVTTVGSTGEDSTSTGSITTVQPTTDNPTTDAMTGDGTATEGVDTTNGMETTEGMTTTNGAECGNDMVETGEDCDGSDLAGEDCASLDEGFVAGRLACNDDCTFDTTGCVTRFCGDDMLQGMEVCDGADLDGQDCTTQGFDGGTLACMAGCAGFDTSGCFGCGDDVIGGAEVCDGTDLNGQDCASQGFDGGTLGCLPDCSAFDTADCSTCGNDLIEGMELCDGTDIGMEDCVSLGFNFGTLACQGDCSDYDLTGCGLFTGDCCADNGTPGCDDSTCTTDMCALDPFCCSNQWDATCAANAFLVCPGICDNCGDNVVNSLAEVCDGTDLVGEDCATQGFDFGTLACAPDCASFDTTLCETFGGDCCTANGTPGCDDPMCTADMCALDPFCCDNQWDSVCADNAFIVCPGICDNCGDGVINSPVEVCDGADLDGADCGALGYQGGVLACQGDCSDFDEAGCNPFAGDCCSANGSIGCSDADCTAAICAADPFCCSVTWDGTCANSATVEPACAGTGSCPGGMLSVEMLQNDNGNCTFTDVGCSDGGGTAGNPQNVVECFQSTLTPPIDVTQVEYSLGDSVPLPDALDVVVFSWAGPGNLPGGLLGSATLDPVVDIVLGFHTFTLPVPINVPTASFCIGFNGADPADGFRVDYTDADNAGEGYLDATACGLAGFAETTGVVGPGDFCIRPTVTSPN